MFGEMPIAKCKWMFGEMPIAKCNCLGEMPIAKCKRMFGEMPQKKTKPKSRTIYTPNWYCCQPLEMKFKGTVSIQNLLVVTCSLSRGTTTITKLNQKKGVLIWTRSFLNSDDLEEIKRSKSDEVAALFEPRDCSVDQSRTLRSLSVRADVGCIDEDYIELRSLRFMDSHCVFINEVCIPGIAEAKILLPFVFLPDFQTMSFEIWPDFLEFINVVIVWFEPLNVVLIGNWIESKVVPKNRSSFDTTRGAFGDFLWILKLNLAFAPVILNKMSLDVSLCDIDYIRSLVSIIVSWAIPGKYQWFALVVFFERLV